MNLYRMYWAEKRFTDRVQSGQEHLALLRLETDKTQAVSLNQAFVKITEKHPELKNKNIWKIAKVEQYDYDKKAWKVVQELGLNTGYLSRKDRENMGRDYPQGSATNGVLGLLGAFALLAGIAFVAAKR
jgi:hypothetical protein